jgi:RNA polymerase sigma factor (TIGR02999 family)
LLQAWSRGEDSALERLVPLVYRDLHQRAHRCMGSERAGHTLQTSALINEAYLRLVGSPPRSWESRTHFFAIAARLMRRILVDHARKKRSLERGVRLLREMKRGSAPASGRTEAP